jgi:hypothetical protein
VIRTNRKTTRAISFQVMPNTIEVLPQVRARRAAPKHGSPKPSAFFEERIIWD